MDWKARLPMGMDVGEQPFEASLAVRRLDERLAREVAGPEGFQLFHRFLHYLLLYTMGCIQENKFPALTRCWHALYPLFGTAEFGNEWFFYCWLCCDFPLELNSDRVVLDEFIAFTLSNDAALSEQTCSHYKGFHLVMKASRLGLYQEKTSTSKLTTFQECFTQDVISTVRSVPEYESGEIFLTRLVTYLGETFQLHNPRCYPPKYKAQLTMLVENKLIYLAKTGDLKQDYINFMKLAGPYWMSCTHPDQNTKILDPDEYLAYYQA